MVFFIGHGSYDNSCDIAASDLSNIDLTGDIILSGACYTGATSSDREPWDFIALKILNRGADIYVSNVIVNGWVNMMFIAKLLCLNQMSMGQVVMAGIDQQMSWGGITGNITQLEIVPANKLDCTQCASATSAKCIINGIARIIPFGDPSYKPKLKSTVVLSFP